MASIMDTAIMLNGHIDSTLLPMYVDICKPKTQLQCPLHMLLPNVPETNMPTKLVIYANYLMCIYGDVYIYIPNVKSLASTM